jgi:uncharacterized protein YlxP (DUF503 family)
MLVLYPETATVAIARTNDEDFSRSQDIGFAFVNNSDRARQTQHDAVFRMCMRESFVLRVRVIEIVETKRQIRREPDAVCKNVRIEAGSHEEAAAVSLRYHKERQTFNARARIL